MRGLGMLFLALGWLVWTARNLFANRGFIPFSPDTRLYEPLQQAVIAWNGEEEILILSTNIHASDSGEVLEVLPLPSEPDVRKGDLGIFRRLEAWAAATLSTGGPRDSMELSKAGEVTFHKTIGAHEISVVHLLDKGRFIGWVEEYLSSLGVQDPRLPEGMEGIIEEYVRDGFEWFVFDVISVDPEVRLNEPIRYRFRTKKLYYPLRVTRMAEGDTEIKLWIMTRNPLTEFEGIPERHILRTLVPAPTPAANLGLGAQMIQLLERKKKGKTTPPPPQNRAFAWEEIRRLDAEIGMLLGNRGPVPIRLWRLFGDISSFDQDLIVR